MLKTVVTTLGLLLGACSVGAVNGGGGDDTTPDGGITGDPRAGTFASEVVPIVMNKGCLNTGACHGGTQNPQMTTFDKMTTNGIPGRYLTTPSATNILITKGDHQGQTYLNDTEKASVAAWIDSGP